MLISFNIFSQEKNTILKTNNNLTSIPTLPDIIEDCSATVEIPEFKKTFSARSGKNYEGLANVDTDTEYIINNTFNITSSFTNQSSLVYISDVPWVLQLAASKMNWYNDRADIEIIFKDNTDSSC